MYRMYRLERGVERLFHVLEEHGVADADAVLQRPEVRRLCQLDHLHVGGGVRIHPEMLV